jgi:predicted Zn-dependent peptidase
VLPRYQKVTAADIQRVTGKYFSERNRTVVTLIPEKETNSQDTKDAKTEESKGEK